MFKRFCFIMAFFLTHTAYSQEYSISNSYVGTIHTTTVVSDWCGNLAVSTRLGNKSGNGPCHYFKETPASGFDTCGPFQLNPYILEKNAGLGFNCAATHVHSNVTGYDGLDEYLLIWDSYGHYIDTKDSKGNIELK